MLLKILKTGFISIVNVAINFIVENKRQQVEASEISHLFVTSVARSFICCWLLASCLILYIQSNIFNFIRLYGCALFLLACLCIHFKKQACAACVASSNRIFALIELLLELLLYNILIYISYLIIN